jgi:predicted ATP-grasp superfamily ATP-dependent carboligase
MNQVVIPGGEHTTLAVVRSLGKKKITSTVISENPHALAFSSKYCTCKIVSDSTLDVFSGFNKEDIVMPVLEDQMLELAKHKNKFPCTVAFPEYSVLEKTSNKKTILERARELNIPCPPTFFFRDHDNDTTKFNDLENMMTFPAVIKPLRGHGGEGISFVNSADQLIKNYNGSVKKHGPVMVQEKIQYDERYSVAVIMNFDQEIRSSCVLKDLRYYPVDSGPATCVETIYRPDLVAYAQEILASLNFYGVAELDFVHDARNNTSLLMEINPRFWGSLQGAVSAGVDFPYQLYTLFTEGDIDKKDSYPLGVRTRNVFYNDYRRLCSIIKGDYTIEYKISSCIEFLQFHRDDAYFIFDLRDMKPFLSLVTDFITRRVNKLAEWQHG